MQYICLFITGGLIAVNKLRFYSVFSIARSEYIRWITNPRILIVGILFIFMKTLAVEPLLERAEKMQDSLTIFEPFIAIGNSGMLVLLMPCVFLILISDYPVINGNTLLFVQRIGKTNWFLGQILFIISAVFSYIGALLIVSIVTSGGTFSLEWSETIRFYASRFPNEYNSFASELIPSNLYNQIPLVTSVIQTFFLMSAYLFILVLILYLFKLMNIKSAGVFAVYTLIGFGVVTCSIKTQSMWIFPMANTIVWLHYTEIMREPVIPIMQSYIYFALIIALLLLCNIVALRKLQFINIEQVG